jgi:hypothetical protein
MIDIDVDSGINLRSDGYLIARTVGMCLHCRGETCLVALMLPPGHESRTTDPDGEQAAEGTSVPGDTWERTSRHAFLFYIESLPDAVRHRLQALAPRYRYAISPATQGSYWANHCERCGGVQEDHELFCEPEGAFLPTSPAAAAIIELLPIPEALEVGAAGYAIDPAFIASQVGA